MEQRDEDGAEDACGKGAEQDGYLAGGAENVCGLRSEFAKGEGIDENCHCETDTSQAGDSEKHFPRCPFWHGSHFAHDGNETGKCDADRFAEQESEEDAHADKACTFDAWQCLENVEETDVGNDNSSVGKCENRHDEEVDPRIEGMFETDRKSVV